MPLPRDAKMTDVPAHTWVLATILKHAGVEFMHIGCNGGSGIGRGSARCSGGKGPTARALLTMYSGDYGTGLKPPADWPYKTWLALIHTGDNHGPPTRGRSQAAARAGGPRGARREDSHGPAVRFQRRHPQGEPHAAGGAGRPGRHLDQGHHVDAHRDQAGPQHPPADRRLRRARTRCCPPGASACRPCRQAVAAAYEGSLLFGEHTWGFDAKTVSPPVWQGLGAGPCRRPVCTSGRILGRKGRLHPKAAEQTLPATAADLEALARRRWTSEGPRIVVFNPLPWPRDGMVTMDLGGKSPKLEDLAIGDFRIRSPWAWIACQPD